jgi:hypothetical protein
VLQYLHVDAFLEVLDIEYAYRLCVEAGLSQACIWLRGVMHKYEEAVDAALASKDIELAKFYAAKPEDGRLDTNLLLNLPFLALSQGYMTIASAHFFFFR